MTIRGAFTRSSPASFAEKIGIPLGWFVISHRWMLDKKARRLAHGRWFRLTTSHGSIYRVLRFSAKLQGTLGGQGEMVIDYPGWLDLIGRAEDSNITAEIDIVPARWWQAGALAVSHPDPSIRLAGWLAMLSVALGSVSILLGVWALLKTYYP